MKPTQDEIDKTFVVKYQIREYPPEVKRISLELLREGFPPSVVESMVRERTGFSPHRKTIRQWGFAENIKGYDRGRKA